MYINLIKVFQESHANTYYAAAICLFSGFLPE